MFRFIVIWIFREKRVRGKHLNIYKKKFKEDIFRISTKMKKCFQNIMTNVKIKEFLLNEFS